MIITYAYQAVICARRFLVIMFLSTLVLLLSGCSALTSTFGKEYVLVDTFYDQLEADIKYSLENYVNSKSDELTEEQKKSYELYLRELEVKIKSSRIGTKSSLPMIKSSLDDMGSKESVSDFVEVTLNTERLELEKQIAEYTGGELVLEHADVHRGFFGSIWHFIRSHWIITLVIMGVLSTVWEKIEPFVKPYLEKFTVNTDQSDNSQA